MVRQLDRKLYSRILEKVKTTLDLSRELSDDEIVDIIDETIIELSKFEYIGIDERVIVANYIFNTIRRLDVIQPYIEDDCITEIMVNGKNDIFIEREGKIIKTDTQFESQQKLEDVIQNIVAKINRTVNEKSPICDARLSDGSRVSIILKPVALNGPILTIRKFTKDVIQMDDLIKWEAISEEGAIFLKKLVKAKYNIFICGGTGSGKTTLLNILSNCIHEDERVITIEDSAELQISHIDNLVKLEARNANVEGKGAITIRELIKASLRMRPDRIIVGEVRGKEAIDMLQAMNTGHDGSISTGHANSAKDMLSRLETMILTAEAMPLKAIQKQIASSVDILIHLSRMRDKSRKVVEITEVVEFDGERIILNPLYIFKEEGELQYDKVIGKLSKTQNEIINDYKLRVYCDR